MEAHKSPVATEAIERIAPLYGIEKEIRSHPPDHSRRVSNDRARPLIEAMHLWLKTSLGKLSRKSDTGRRSTMRSRSGTRWRTISRIAASRSITPPQLSLRRLRSRRRMSGCLLYPPRFGQAQRSRPRSLPAACAYPYRRSPHQPDRANGAGSCRPGAEYGSRWRGSGPALSRSGPRCSAAGEEPEPFPVKEKRWCVDIGEGARSDRPDRQPRDRGTAAPTWPPSSGSRGSSPRPAAT